MIKLKKENKRAQEEEESIRRRAALYAPFSCKGINESAGGYSLIGYLSNNNDSRKVQVGELVGIKDSTNASSTDLGVGVIRRIKNWDEGLELGIQKLSPCAVAIAIANTNNDSSQNELQQEKFHRGLAIPEISALGQHPTIITHTWHRTGDEVVVHAHGQQSRLSLGRQLENTGVYAQFEYRVTDTESGITSLDGNTTQDEFKDIWDQL